MVGNTTGNVFVFGHNYFFSEALGPRDCERNVTMNNIANSIVYVPNGTVCFECVQADVIAFPFTFIIRDKIVNSSYPLAKTVHGDVVDILVVPNTERVFKTSSATTVQCCERLISLECDKNFDTMKADVFLYYSKSFHWLFNNRLPSQHSTVLGSVERLQ